MTQRSHVPGAPCGTGNELLDPALARAHALFALVRSPRKIIQTHLSMAGVEGNPLPADALARARSGRDAQGRGAQVHPLFDLAAPGRDA